MSDLPCSNSEFRILVVEDDPHIRDVLDYALKNEGYSVELVDRGKKALELCQKSPAPDLMVLDVGLPDIDGFEICRRVRQFSELPILFLTSKGDEINRVVGLEIGGDDYVVKPFSNRELLARIKVIRRHLLRQSPGNEERGRLVKYGPITIDGDRHQVCYEGHEIKLTRQEYKVLEILISQPGRVFTREQFLDVAWEDGGMVTDRTIDAHIKTVRRKFSGFDFVETMRGIGYRARLL